MCGFVHVDNMCGHVSNCMLLGITYDLGLGVSLAKRCIFEGSPCIGRIKLLMFSLCI